MIKPLDFLLGWQDRIYITVEEKAEKIGQIEMPGNARMRSQIGVVQVFGDEVKGLKVGDKILISFDAGIHIQLPETYSFEPHHRVIRDSEIIMRVKNEKD